MKKKKTQHVTEEQLESKMRILREAIQSDMTELGAMFVEEDPEQPGSGIMVPRFATKRDMKPILDLYRGSTLVKSLFAGLAAFVITLVAVGYALIQLVQWLRGSH